MEYQEGPSEYKGKEHTPPPSLFDHSEFSESLSDLTSTSSDAGSEVGWSMGNIQTYLKKGEALQDSADDGYIRPGVEEGNQARGFERTGVTHLVHAWHSQGHQRPTVNFPHLYKW
jgi:hypothetical protein